MARRSNGEGSFYQQKDKSWVYQVTYGRKEDGSPYRKAFKGRSGRLSKDAPKRSARSAGRSGKKNRRVSRRRRKHRRRNPPVSKNSGPSSATPSRRRYCSQKPSLNGLSFTNRRLPESRLPMQAIWIPIGFISRKPLETCRSTRSPRTPYRPIIKENRKTAAVWMGGKAACPQRPFRTSICC